MGVRTATVITDALNLRGGPGTDFARIGLLTGGATVTVTGRHGAWRLVQTTAGMGFVHGDFISFDGLTPATDEADPSEPEVDAAGQPFAPVEPDTTYTVTSGDTLSAIGARLGIDWRAIAEANLLVDPFVIAVGQVLRLPGSALEPATLVPAGTLVLRDPFHGALTRVTSSSNPPDNHHTPYGGTHSCDLDVAGDDASRGTPVFFEVSGGALEVRGIVAAIGPACASGRISDGGHKVQIRLQKRQPGGTWEDSDAWVLYGHLDPVEVTLGAAIEPGSLLGHLGPPRPEPEYQSSCAVGSHTHVEARPGTWVVDVNATTEGGAVMRITL